MSEYTREELLALSGTLKQAVRQVIGRKESNRKGCDMCERVKEQAELRQERRAKALRVERAAKQWRKHQARITEQLLTREIDEFVDN